MSAVLAGLFCGGLWGRVCQRPGQGGCVHAYTRVGTVSVPYLGVRVRVRVRVVFACASGVCVCGCARVRAEPSQVLCGSPAIFPRLSPPVPVFRDRVDDNPQPTCSKRSFGWRLLSDRPCCSTTDPAGVPGVRGAPGRLLQQQLPDCASKGDHVDDVAPPTDPAQGGPGHTQPAVCPSSRRPSPRLCPTGLCVWTWFLGCLGAGGASDSPQHPSPDACCLCWVVGRAGCSGPGLSPVEPSGGTRGSPFGSLPPSVLYRDPK